MLDAGGIKYACLGPVVVVVVVVVLVVMMKVKQESQGPMY